MFNLQEKLKNKNRESMRTVIWDDVVVAIQSNVKGAGRVTPLNGT